MSGIDERWWAAVNERKLLFQRCRACSGVNFYPRHACVHCLSPDLEWREAAGPGTVYACTRVHRAAAAAFQDDVPYVVVLADMDDGFRLMAKVRSGAPDDLAVGDRVRIAFEADPGGGLRPCFEFALPPG